MRALICVLVLIFAVTVSGVPLTEQNLRLNKEFKALVEAMTIGKIEPFKQGVSKRELGFFYTNCGYPNKELLIVDSFSVKPDPIELPGNLTVSTTAKFVKQLGTPLTANLTVWKNVAGDWIKIQCVDNFGSCTYSDICSKLPSLIKTCPPEIVKQGYNCRCPFKAGTASVTNLNVPVSAKFPSFAVGDLKVIIELSTGSTPVTCMEFLVSFA